MKDLYPIIADILETNGTATFTVSGVSMQPMVYNKRDTVTLEKPNGPLKKFDLPFYLMDDGRFIMHRVIKVHKDGTYECRGDNCWVSEDPIREDQIIGIVKSFTRNGKKIDVNKSFGYFVYTRTWPLLHHFKKWYSVIRALKKKINSLKEFFYPEKIQIKKRDGNMTEISYRAANANEVNELINLYIKLVAYEKENFGGASTSSSWLNSNAAKKYFENYFKYNFVYCAFENKKMIGFFCGSVKDSELNEFPIGSCQGVYVEPEYRGAGIAKKFLSEFKEYCKKRDCYHIEIRFFSDNTAAEALYKKSGFSEYKKTFLCELD